MPISQMGLRKWQHRNFANFIPSFLTCQALSRSAVQQAR